MSSAMFRRRDFIGSIGVSLVAWSAGCGNPDAEPFRMLLFRDISIQKTEEGWRASFDVVNNSQARDELATFHDVRIHGYSRDRTEVCVKDIGTISDRWHEGNRMSVEMTCSAFPVMITFEAAESPCDDEVRTVLAIAVYDDEEEWSHDRYSRNCGEGLPPEPRAEPEDGS